MEPSDAAATVADKMGGDKLKEERGATAVASEVLDEAPVPNDSEEALKLKLVTPDGAAVANEVLEGAPVPIDDEAARKLKLVAPDDAGEAKIALLLGLMDDDAPNMDDDVVKSPLPAKLNPLPPKTDAGGEPSPGAGLALAGDIVAAPNVGGVAKIAPRGCDDDKVPNREGTDDEPKADGEPKRGAPFVVADNVAVAAGGMAKREPVLALVDSDGNGDVDDAPNNGAEELKDASAAVTRWRSKLKPVVAAKGEPKAAPGDAPKPKPEAFTSALPKPTNAAAPAGAPPTLGSSRCEAPLEDATVLEPISDPSEPAVVSEADPSEPAAKSEAGCRRFSCLSSSSCAAKSRNGETASGVC